MVSTYPIKQCASEIPSFQSSGRGEPSHKIPCLCSDTQKVIKKSSFVNSIAFFIPYTTLLNAYLYKLAANT